VTRDLALEAMLDGRDERACGGCMDVPTFPR
jgi:hypothetical protein